MDKTFIELLKTVGNQIDHAELNAAIKADNFEGEYALSEDGLTSAKEQVGKLLTLESAINNPTVIESINKEYYPQHVKTAYKKFDSTLLPLLNKLGIDHTKYEFISESIADIEEALEKAKEGGGSDNKDLIDSLKADLLKANESLQGKDEEFNIKMNEKDASYELEKLKDQFFLKANEFTWADAYADKDLKRALLNQKWDKINANAHLKLDDGEIIVRQKDMPDKEIYDDGNKIITFQSMLEPELEPYLKKSNPDKVRTEQTKEKPVKELSAQEAKNLAELARQRNMYA